MSILLNDRPGRATPGYFRIGDVILDIPPEQIVTDKVTSNEEVATLRTKSPMWRKTGHSRWDITISWKVLRETGENYQYTQYDNLQRIAAMVRCAPFVEVFNRHVRQVLMEEDPQFTDVDRLAVALKQLRVTTHDDLADGLDCVLTMTLFNYRPYTTDFSYVGDGDAAVSADESPAFTTFLDDWITRNIDAYTDFDYRKQEPGVVRFNFRQYRPVGLGALERNTLETAKPAARPTASASVSAARSDVTQLVIQTAEAVGLDPYLALAVARQESNFDQSRISPKGAIGVMQLMPKTAAGLKVDPYDKTANIQGGVRYLKGLLRQFGTEEKALWAYNAGPGNASNGIKPLETQKYVPSVLRFKQQFQAKYPDLVVTAEAPQPSDLKPVAFDVPTEQQVAESLAGLMRAGWLYDHRTENVAFLFREDTIDCSPDGMQDGENDLTPHQATVVISNNFAQIPLHAFAYPTYQHVAPPSTAVSILFVSHSTADVDDEPDHPTLARLSGMAAMLENQFLEMRKQWRSAASVHRMQCCTIENQVLNLLGIKGAIVQGISTETIPESPDLVQAQITLSQYDNVFENVEAYRVKNGTKDALAQWNTILLDPKLADKFPGKDERKQLSPVLDYQKAALTNDQGTLVKFLQDPNAKPEPVQMPVKLTADELKNVQAAMYRQPAFDAKLASGMAAAGAMSGSMTGAPTPQPSFGQTNPQIAQRVDRGQMSYNDWILLSNGLSKDASFQQASKSVLGRMSEDQKKQASNALYAQVLQYRYNNDPTFAQAVQAIETSPQFKDGFATAFNTKPQAANEDHGAYADFGLSSDVLPPGTQSPAFYFTDYSKKFLDALHSSSDELAAQAASAAQTLNAPVGRGVQVNTVDNGLLTGCVNTMLKRAVHPNFSMARAYPTFKLFLMEEDNSGVFECFDDFYSYNCIQSIETIRYQDKPDTAVLTLTNFSNLLTHRVFDNSVMGKREQKLNAPWSRHTPQADNGDQIAGPDGGPITGDVVNRTAAGVKSQDLGQKIFIPYQYYALQTGAKIQIRMGFANDPDKLFPIFTGKVTQIDNSDMMVITAQGHLLELMEQVGDHLETDGYLNFSLLSDTVKRLGTIGKDLIGSVPHPIDSGSQVMAGLSELLSRGPAYGGWTLFGAKGNAEDVIGAVIKAPTASHFGHWQVLEVSDPLLKGFNWGVLASKGAAAAGYKRFASLLENLTDRSDENIMVNHVISLDGTESKLDTPAMRSWLYERPIMAILPSSYSVPNDPTLTPWRVIKDVARRYPDYILTVKPYGFPFGADSTLVFANPNDVYVSRRRRLGEAEITTFTDADNPDFIKWWNSYGERETRLAFSHLSDSVWHQGLLANVVQVYSAPNKNLVALRKLNDEVQRDGVDSAPFKNLLASIRDGKAPAFERLVTAVTEVTTSWENRILRSGESDDLRKTMIELLRSFRYFQQVPRDPGSNGSPTLPAPSDRVQPVRKWHLVTEANIISNGITLNSNIYNTVKVDKKMYQASSSIPPQYQRMLDCDPLIINPYENVHANNLSVAYAQSFLREEVGKMYRGELVLTGIPEIEPWDVIVLIDPARGMAGPIEVESVIHSFDLESGYITIVRPRAMILVNEAASAGTLSALWSMASNLRNEMASVHEIWTGQTGQQQASEVGSMVAGAGTTVAATLSAKAALGTASTALASGASSVATTVANAAAAGEAGGALGLAATATDAIATGTATAAELIAGGVTGAASMVGGLGVAALIAAFLAYEVTVLACERQEANPMFIAPLSVYNRPWVGGIEGWQITDLAHLLNNKFQNFADAEIWSTWEGFKKASQILRDTGN